VKSSPGSPQSCDRCRHRPVFARFIAGNRAALRFRGTGEFSLCSACFDALKSFVGRSLAGVDGDVLPEEADAVPPWEPKVTDQKESRSGASPPALGKRR
jgi:hypothetical protein